MGQVNWNLYHNVEFEHGTLHQIRLVCKYCLNHIVLSDWIPKSGGLAKHVILNYDPNFKLHKSFPLPDPNYRVRYTSKRSLNRFWKLECPNCDELLLIECRQGSGIIPSHKASYLFPDLVPCSSGFLGEDIKRLEDVEGNVYELLKDGRLRKMIFIDGNE
jgi:hypothetical protein